MSLYKEDVYETEDIPCEQSVEVEEQFEQPEVEKIHLDVGGVRKRFGNCILDAESAGKEGRVIIWEAEISGKI